MVRILIISILLSLVSASSPSYDRKECQKPGNTKLKGCPKHTLVVGSSSNFTSIQHAILSLPNNGDPYTILIQPGNYTEQLNITRPGPLTLLGVTASPNDKAGNLVNVIWHNATGTVTTGTYDNAYTSTLTIAPTLNSSFTGTGPTGFAVPADTPFGNVDFRTYNLNFINDYLPYAAGPSLALSLSYANGGFYYTRFLSYQDTVYIGKLGNAYMYDSEIAGQTDFFYGFGTCWVTKSAVTLRGCGGGITAWKGTNTTFENKYGVYIHDSTVKKANASLDVTNECYLGRPWNAQHRSIFAYSYLDDSINPSGYVQWNPNDPRVNRSKLLPAKPKGFWSPPLTVFPRADTSMAEYKDFGPGFNATGRAAAANVTIELTKRQYAPFAAPERVFQFPSGEFGNTAWIDKRPRA